MPDQGKSVLDNIPRICAICKEPLEAHTNGMPCGMEKTGTRWTVKDQPLGIVGACPVCGSPLYGERMMFKDDPPPTVRRTCKCGNPPALQMQTK